jgi:hypothetical protein
MEEGAIDPENAGFEWGRTSSDCQQALEAGESCSGGFVEERTGGRCGGRYADRVSERIEAASDASEGFADLAERPLLGAHGREV